MHGWIHGRTEAWRKKDVDAENVIQRWPKRRGEDESATKERSGMEKKDREG